MKNFIKSILFITFISLVVSCSGDIEESEDFSDGEKAIGVVFLKKNDAMSKFSVTSMQQLKNLEKKIENGKFESKQKYEDFDHDRFEKLLVTELLNDSEVLELKMYLAYLGFNNKKEYREYASTIERLIKILATQTNYFEMKRDDQISLFTKYFSGILDKSHLKGPEEVCKDQAQAEHTVGIIACTGASIGVGSLTGGVGGVVFQSFCLAANMDLYMANLAACDEDESLVE